MTDEPGWPHGASPESHVVLDAKGLRALAHPVRVQLLGLLRTHGPSTATRLAERTGLTSGATSYHLRRLATAGFVEEDSERGNARDRWWRAVHRFTWWTDMSLADQEPEATLTYWQSIVSANARRAQQALGAYQTMPRDWRHAFDLSDWMLRLTPDEAHRLAVELAEVVGRYRPDDPEDLAAAPEGSARVALAIQVLPDPEATAEDLGEEPATGPLPEPGAVSDTGARDDGAGGGAPHGERSQDEQGGAAARESEEDR
ncbi:ArsR/SmtB family transcription factor [Kitasatospora sp. NPDC054939]